jgi:hypothetical protein
MSDAPDHDDDDLLDEYLAVVARVDAAVADAATRAGDALVCARGCHACCAPGLSVLPVEAERIARHLESRTVIAGPQTDRCTFLDAAGACQIYEARPLLCRTHGLALRTSSAPARGLKVIDDISVCTLNYTTRSPTPAETLDADRILALLVTVDRRFRIHAGLPDDGSRVSLEALLEPADEQDTDPELEPAT